MSAPEVSVVVATYQRADRLPRLIAALEAQTLDRDRFEVVIVDNGSTDETATVLAQLCGDATIDLRTVRVPVNQGPGRGRNFGWRVAAGEVIAFTDDDCAPAPCWLEEGLRALGEWAGVVGRTDPDPAFEHRRGPFSRTQKVRSATYMPTCNVFYRREDLEAVGGFDDAVRAKGGEDTDLAWRIADLLGADFTFADDAVVLHDISRSDYRIALREAATWVDLPLVVARHPRRARPLLAHGVFWKSTHLPALLVVAAGVGVATTRRPWWLLATWPWINLRLRKVPVTRSRPRRIALAPQVLLIDLVEVSTMVRGSIRHGTFVL